MSDNIVGIEKPHPEWVGWSNEKRECFGTIPNNKWFYVILIALVAIVVYFVYHRYYM